MSSVAVAYSAPSELRFRGRRLSGAGSGVCGVYFVRRPTTGRDARAVDYVFKPRIEEPSEPISKDKLVAKKPSPVIRSIMAGERIGTASPIKNGVIVGDAVLKERAAYLVDHDQWAGVPRTEAVRVSIELDDTGAVVRDFGSLQAFVQHDSTSEDVGCALFDKNDVHRIGLLDARLFNLDRHEGNLLVHRREDGRVRLVPIDHGYALPSWRDLSDASFCWQTWKQASLPFSDEVVAYVADLCPKRDIVPLLNLGLKHECVVTYIICSSFVKKAVAAGLTLADIGSILQRDMLSPDDPSEFELIVRSAASATDFFSFVFQSKSSWDDERVADFLEAFGRLADQLIDHRCEHRRQSMSTTCSASCASDSGISSTVRHRSHVASSS
ncbi:PI3K/PI4K catalytic domain-containing protein [Plasmodiophora brassicae]